MIPIYRAKKIDSDEYVEGYYTPLDSDEHNEIQHMIYSRNLKAEWQVMHIVGLEAYEIDQSTLSINFEDMIDSEGTKIFASLSEDGKGGYKLEVLDCETSEYVSVYDKHSYGFGAMNINPKKDEWEFELFYDLDVKVIGIQQ